VDSTETPAPAAAPERRLPFHRPADYYSSPVEDQRRLFPRWVTLGCGTASIVVIVGLFVVGALVSSGRLGGVFELIFGQLQVELRGQFTKDVSAAQRAAFDAEMKTLLDNLHHGRIRSERLQPIMRTVREVTADEKIDPREAQKLIEMVHAVNQVNGPKK
jgi:hypothetical protein